MPQHFVDEQLGFAEHRGFEHVVEFGIQNLARLGGFEIAQVQPLADEIFGQCGGFRIVEHSIDLPPQHVRLAELVFLGQAEQFFIGHRAPKEIRKPIGQREIIEHPPRQAPRAVALGRT